MGIFTAVTGGLLGLLQEAEGKKATKKAAQQVTDAANKNTALAGRIYDQTRSDLAPFRGAGAAGLDGLMRELGLSGGNAPAPSQPRAYDRAGNIVAAPQGASPMPAGGPGKTPGGFAGTSPMEAAQPGRMDAQAYWDGNPDLAADQSLAGFNPGDLTGDGTVDNADRGAWHYQNYGQNEGRNAPQMPGQPQGQTQEQPQTGFDPTRPQAQAAPEFGPRQDVAMGSYGQAPDMSQFLGNYEESPEFKFAVQKALERVNAASAVRGKLRSGDTAKALAGETVGLQSQDRQNYFNRGMQMFSASRGAYENDRGDARSLWNQQQSRADTNYGADRSFGTGMWQYGTERGDANFNYDRGYNADRTDQRTGNYFNLANIGQNAAAGTASAGQNYYQASASNTNNAANANANRYLTNNANRNNMFGQAAQVAGMYFGGGF